MSDEANRRPRPTALPPFEPIPGVKTQRIPRITKAGLKIYTYRSHRKTGVKLYGEPGTPEFDQQLSECERSPDARLTDGRPGTVRHEVGEYKKVSPKFKQNTPRTQLYHVRALDLFVEALGDLLVSRLATKDTTVQIRRLADKLYAGRPAARDVFLDRISAFCTWCVEENHIPYNPVAQRFIKRVNVSERHEPWPISACRKFLESKHREADLTTFMILRCTGLRISDVAKLRWTDWIEGDDRDYFYVKPLKTYRKKPEPVLVAIHRDLRTYLMTLPRVGEFIVTHGRFNKRYKDGDSLGKAFIRACQRAGLECLTAHGLRHSMGDAIADEEGPDIEIAEFLAITRQTAGVYSQGANTRRLRERAMKRIEAVSDWLPTPKPTRSP